MLLHSGDSLSVAASARPVDGAVGPRRAPPASVTVSLKGTAVGTWALTTAHSLSGPSPWWKLLAG